MSHLLWLAITPRIRTAAAGTPHRSERTMLNRRTLFASFAIAATLADVASASSQTYPSRPVRLVVGFSAGSVPDTLARLIGQWLSDRLGQPVVIDNRPGAGSNLGTEAVVKAAPDGHTLLLFGPAAAINATLYQKLNFNFLRDIAPVASIVHQPEVMVVNPSVPARTIPEFIGYAKTNPGRINMASSGIGSGPHLAGELFKMMAGIEMSHVPYRGGGQAITDLIAGQVQVMFIVPIISIEHIRAGKLRALAVTTATRSDVLPDVPTVGEFVTGYEGGGWFGIGVPRNTPAEIIDKLNKEINAGLADPNMRARFAELGGGVVASSPAEFSRIIAEETERWGKVVKFSGAKPE